MGGKQSKSQKKKEDDSQSEREAQKTRVTVLKYQEYLDQLKVILNERCPRDVSGLILSFVPRSRVIDECKHSVDKGTPIHWINLNLVTPHALAAARLLTEFMDTTPLCLCGALMDPRIIRDPSSLRQSECDECHRSGFTRLLFCESPSSGEAQRHPQTDSFRMCHECYANNMEQKARSERIPRVDQKVVDANPGFPLWFPFSEIRQLENGLRWSNGDIMDLTNRSSVSRRVGLDFTGDLVRIRMRHRQKCMVPRVFLSMSTDGWWNVALLDLRKPEDFDLSACLVDHYGMDECHFILNGTNEVKLTADEKKTIEDQMIQLKTNGKFPELYPVLFECSVSGNIDVETAILDMIGYHLSQKTFDEASAVVVHA